MHTSELVSRSLLWPVLDVGQDVVFVHDFLLHFSDCSSVWVLLLHLDLLLLHPANHARPPVEEVNHTLTQVKPKYSTVVGSGWIDHEK